MGQKINPRGLRIRITEDWDTNWYANHNYAELLSEDVEIRKYLKEHLYKAGVSKIKLSRRANQITVDLYTAKPGLIIGRGGRDIAVVRDALIKKIGKQIQLNIHEEKNAEINAQLVAESVAGQLERRISFRRTMKQAVSKVLRAHAKGVKIRCAGRLDGAEIARKECYRMGRVPLHTLRAKIDYGTAEAQTIYGIIGIKVWVYTGDMIAGKEVIKSGTDTKENKI
ncbi:30S ribosomal protein S3 [candidate division WOR-1 bacterium RIFOXYA12_FULL_43_27]|uniref:Small ribosomal subunit protein uS3 n=1 Tax=candidate division WOR-1 bacterium RIFOXYC2_FULL_46_14 TaxID=1802587 RepID=A0A1F4U5N3_UNCSA|nr:MAG: 30S ribosomal protein S3 [candidate division WOR-1 bacterium RIFOXYA12_FULL_43_27]OGC20440.1 MAG: 30S ribosomal protein S3 [candidate division WOR-1 bacterium RIFOXYB2_FULL_46_45]OGC31823.1 MAG: 30S ribosomal protein S3 [candidate division WOR-1 bacterium RIFOXYA2_FULL_46_56]OGC40285.1 MAG: 30S ribosomal protein S3 [candidate division WOR-1 bacterium RIFOXYC2_FULL_46_14]